MQNVIIHESLRVVKPRNLVLNHVIRLPMAARLCLGMRTICDVCRKPITDAYFYGGFVTDHKNLLLHEVCTPEAMRIADVSVEEP